MGRTRGRSMKHTKKELLQHHKDVKKVIREIGGDCYDKMEVALVDRLLAELAESKRKLNKVLRHTYCKKCYEHITEALQSDT